MASCVVGRGRTVGAVAVVHLLLLLLLLACWGLMLGASATLWCDGTESHDPYFVSNVRTVVERMATLTAARPELDYITQDAGPMANGAPQWTVYGKAKCKVSDGHACGVCLNNGWLKMDEECHYRFGAQYFTDECTMRYELYSDFGLQ